MNATTIHHWHRHYRLHRPQVLTWEGLASTEVLVAFDAALNEVILDESEVVLVRSVKLRFTAVEPQGSTHDLAVQWGRAMATAVRDVVVHNDPANVRRFADRVEHLICYLQAVLTGGQPDDWYFASLAERVIRNSDAAADFDELLTAYLDEWRTVFTRLSQRGLLMALLRRVSLPMRQKLWEAGLRAANVTQNQEPQRPLFAAALRIVEQLSGREFPRGDCDLAFQAFVSGRQPALAWSDAASLSAVVYSAVDFLWDWFGVSTVPAADDDENIAVRAAAAVASLDWLDRALLEQRLCQRLERIELRDRASPSMSDDAEPRGQAYARAWQFVESRFWAEWDPETPASATNCLLAMSLIIELQADLAQDPGLARFIERRLRSHRVTPIGNSGAALTSQQSHRVVRDTNSALSTAFAGAFLLARSIHDLRLPGLARTAGFPTTAAHGAARLLGELASKWIAWPLADEFDPGLLAFARLAGPAECADLLLPLNDTACEASGPRFQTQLAQTLVGLGTWSAPARLQVLGQQTAAGGAWLLGGDATAQVFPWCQPIDGPAQGERTIEMWRSELAGWTGQSVELDVADSLRENLVPRSLEGEAKSCSQTWHEATLSATAGCVVRQWARSLHGLQDSSTEYLLRELVRRPGTVQVVGERLNVVLETRPLDAALRISGMLEPFDFFNGQKRININFHAS